MECPYLRGHPANPVIEGKTQCVRTSDPVIGTQGERCICCLLNLTLIAVNNLVATMLHNRLEDSIRHRS